ncbi:MerR family transcriptional regulator [bacterium]|nr:MerR family transcriptional regulator [bacterium]MBU3955785.1 MerR family transcriptional regulator [bacterium]MBU4134294.1 MerR family transcriptional regulator [bacterium]
MHIPGKKFFTIKETSAITKIPPHVLRYWEKEFQLLKPIRRESGQRRYTASHIHMIEDIRELLYIKKFTIAGAKKELVKNRNRNPQIELLMGQNPAAIDLLKKAKAELQTIFKMLSKD